MVDAQKLAKVRSAFGPIGLVNTIGEKATLAPAPAANEEWQLPHGFARVWYGEGASGVHRPVILADGFNLGRSDLDELYQGLESVGFASGLRARGRTLILIGFEERSASILENADTATAAIQRAIAEQMGDSRLLVGGFSMGGLVTRYALARLEHQRMDHRTGVYVSFDSPHRGAWVPIALQGFAHYIADIDDTYLRQISSPAAQQALRWHLPSIDAQAAESPLRTEFLRKLAEVGNWPRIPRTLAVANGAGNGRPNGVPAGAEALRANGPFFAGTTLRTQSQGRNQVVANLDGILGPRQIVTNEIPEVDGAPGGTLESFGILADALKSFTENVDVSYRSVCFVPSVSAVAVRDLDRQEDLYVNIDQLNPDESEVDDYLLSDSNTAHSSLTREIAEWVFDRLPE